MSAACPHCRACVPVKAAAGETVSLLCPRCLHSFGYLVPDDVVAAEQFAGALPDSPLAGCSASGSSIAASETDANHPSSAEPAVLTEPSSTTRRSTSVKSHRVRIGRQSEPRSASVPPSCPGTPEEGHRSRPDEVRHLPPLSARIGGRRSLSVWQDLSPGGDQSNDVEPLHIPGYRIEKELGSGGMGRVYLARQLSLDRPVALKVMSREWAADPIFVARFTREAYAAAQLSHPNIVRIYDIGQTQGTHYFSMEYVPGESLADLVKRCGPLDPETAVGVILQAARGLKHAHDRGLIHRDVKPDNLLIDDQGVVKVADLGLVKGWSEAERLRGTLKEAPMPDLSATPRPKSALSVASVGLTGARMALGTPAYMSPEQCRDAAAVDHRADIYSLGCTLYVLVTGRPPFDANTAVELMTKQAYEPLVPPEQIVSRVPPELSTIIQKMMAKEPEDRFADMGEVIRSLENWLGVRQVGTFLPREEEILQIEDCAERFANCPLGLLRRRLIGGFYAALLVGMVLLLFFGQPVWAFGLASLGLQAALAYFLVDGLTRPNHYLFQRTKQFVWGLPKEDWVVVAALAVLFALGLRMFDACCQWMGFGLIGAGLAIALRFGLDRLIEWQRYAPLYSATRLLAQMRRRGLSEEELRLFVARYSGRRWEEFFESLFGYEAKLATRALLSRGGATGPRDTYAAWREPIIHFMNDVEKRRQERRERALLEAIEQAQLLATGLEASAAAQQARSTAAAIVRRGQRVRSADLQPSPGDPASTVRSRHALEGIVTGAEASTAEFVLPSTSSHWADRLAWALLGPHVRLALAALLLTLGTAWVMQNNLLGSAGASDEPLVLANLPMEWTRWVDRWNVLAAGALLLASLFVQGHVAALLAMLGAAIVLLGHHFGIRPVEPFREYHVAIILGTIIAILGFRFGRRP